MEQDLSTLDVFKLSPLSPEVISRQATINIGMPLVLSMRQCSSLRDAYFCFNWDCIDISVAVLLSSCANLPLVSKIKCMKFKGKKAPPVMKYVYVYVLRKYPFWNVQVPLGTWPMGSLRLSKQSQVYR